MEGRPAGPMTKRIPTPEEEAEKGEYRDEEGFLYLPSEAFRASLMHGAGGRRIGKTAARTVLSGSMFTTSPRTYLVDPESGERLREYRVHVARVVVQRSSILRARPEIEPQVPQRRPAAKRKSEEVPGTLWPHHTRSSKFLRTFPNPTAKVLSRLVR